MADRLLHVGPPGEMRTLFRTDARQDSPRASTSEVLLNGVLGGLLQDTRRGGIDSGGVGIAHRRFPENRRWAIPTPPESIPPRRVSCSRPPRTPFRSTSEVDARGESCLASVRNSVRISPGGPT